MSSDLQSGVKTIVSARWAFAALKTNGSVITWGQLEHGCAFSNFSELLQNGVIEIEVIDSNKKFCATKYDGTQVQWS